MNTNPFDRLNAESPESRFAQIQPNECGEDIDAHIPPFENVHENVQRVEPDSWLEEAYELRTHVED